jgi:heat-inducible transcriptional repressor
MEEAVLDARAQEILRGIIANYVLTGEPVGSRFISRMTREALSPASVRNVMADLEEMGLLAQPHASAGRIPTDKGYRYYVDTLLTTEAPSERDRALIDESLRKVAGEFSETMEVVPKLLSLLTRQVAYFISPPIADTVLKHVEFVRLHRGRILVVFVDAAEVVSHRIIDTEEDYSQQDLERAGHYLVAEFAGLTLSQIRGRLVRLMAEDKAAFDRLVKNAIALGTRYLAAESEERKMVMEGTTNMMKHPEFSDAETMRRLFETFEEKHHLVKLLDSCLDRRGVRVVIGSESHDPALGNLSLVASSYKVSDGGTSCFGILGPTRMEYDRAVALVDYISRLLCNDLTRPRG